MSVENLINSENYEGVKIEKEKIISELKKVDEAKRILEKKYPHYGVIKSFIEHLASTEKVFILAGIKNFGGDEIMDVFIDSETEVMSGETGIEEDVFDHIKEEFVMTHKTVSDIKDVADRLREKYPDKIYKSESFINKIEEYLMRLLEISEGSREVGFDLDKEKEKVIYEIMQTVGEGDELEINKLKEIYQEFKEELKKIG